MDDAEDEKEFFMCSQGVVFAEFTQAVQVQISDEGAQAAKDNGDLEQLRLISEVQGTYQLLGHTRVRSPVFRQEIAGPPADGQLFLFHSGDKQMLGWYIGTEYCGSKQEIDLVAKAGGIKAWSKGSGEASSPIVLSTLTELHCPFWAKRACPGLGMVSLLEAQGVMLKKLQQELELKNHALQLQLEPSQAKSSDDKGKGSDPPSHAWLPKCAKLVAAYSSSEWSTCDDLCQEYCKNSIVNKLVNKQMT